MITNDRSWGRDLSSNGLEMPRIGYTGANGGPWDIVRSRGTMYDVHGGPKLADRAIWLGSMSDFRQSIDIING